MGVHKALLSWRGEPLVAHQVRTLSEAEFAPIVVVTGAESKVVAAATPNEATVVDHSDWRAGRSSSIEAGADALPDEPCSILVVGVDQPLSSRVLARLVEHAGDSLVEPVDESGRPGHPVLLGGEYVRALRTIRERPEGLRSLVRALRSRGTTVMVEGLPHWDLNDPEAYLRARARARDS